MTFEATPPPDMVCQGERLTGTALDDVTDVALVCGRQVYFTTGGTHPWTVPAGITSVSVVAVGAGGAPASPVGGGGGELCYANNVTVTPGSTINVVVGAFGAGSASKFGDVLWANGGGRAVGLEFAPGGTGGFGGTCFPAGVGGYNHDGGGAAGYSGAGGAGFPGNGSPGAGQGGGGGGGNGAVGGGVGLNGAGANGEPNSGNGSVADITVPVAGGGGSAAHGEHVMNGGVRIIWGAGRSYPDNAANE